MKFIPVLKITLLTTIICGFSFKTQAQQLASQKPLTAFYTKKTQDRLAANRASFPNSSSSLQNQRNLPSVKPLPKQATDYKINNPAIARNAALPENEKMKKLPSKSALTVNQIADRKPAARKPNLH